VAIATYSDLVQAVNDWVNDSAVEQTVPTLISLAEAKFNRELRVRDMITRSTSQTSDEFVAVPNDFLQDVSLELDMTNLAAQQSLAYIGPQEAKVLKANKITGLVRYYSIIDGAFELLPAPTSDVDVILTYYAKIPALSATNTTNWLLTKSPDLYLYSTLLEAAPFFKDDARIPVWTAMRQKVMDDMQLESERAQRQTISLNARRRGFF
jgi:hypothetical protein